MAIEQGDEPLFCGLLRAIARNAPSRMLISGVEVAMSQRNSGYERKNLDAYATPSWVTEALVGFIVARPGSIWEPACGTGEMVEVLKRDFVVLATDIDNIGVDFLSTKAP